MRRCKDLFMLLVALWLPLQAASALAMPFCRHAADAVEQQVAAHGEAHCHESSAPASEPTAALDCDNCEMCHLATAGYLPASATSRLERASSVLAALPLAAPPSHVGDPPQHPPRRLN
jgi:hypothetical protein